MLRYIVLSLVTLHAVCVLGNRIVGGSNANITEVPYLVMTLADEGGYLYILGGGSIISEKVVLSSASYYLREQTYYIRYGSSFRNQYGTEVRVAKKILHEGLSFDTFQHNIGLLILEEAIKIDNFAKPIALPDIGEKIEDGTMVTISGWGHMLGEPGKPNIYAEILQKTEVPIVNIDKCAAKYNETRYKIYPGMLCKGWEEEGINHCVGDAGGPAVANNKLYGIISWRIRPCVFSKYPAVFTDVVYYREWIKTNLEENNLSLPF